MCFNQTFLIKWRAETFVATFERRLNIAGESVVGFGSFERTVRMNHFTKTNWTSQICSLSLSQWRKTSWWNRACVQGCANVKHKSFVCGFAAYVLLNDRAKSASCDVPITYPPPSRVHISDWPFKVSCNGQPSIIVRDHSCSAFLMTQTNILYQCYCTSQSDKKEE